MQPSMAANLLLPFDSFYKTWKDRPKDKIVEKLLEIGTLSTLTEVKFKLCSECQQVSQFPQGDMYTTRKPKGNSTFSTLEERLAEDIWQLMVCLDTHYQKYGTFCSRFSCQRLSPFYMPNIA
jgi:hypothetical protein